jgi:peptide/nickel transport system substrate-binding protein/oligopeptide transport system substrate-binding protein
VRYEGPYAGQGREGSHRFPLLLFLLSIACTLSLAVCSTWAGEQRPSSEGLYRRPLGHSPETLDPARISDIYSRSVAQQLFDGLVQFDHTLSIAPALAQFWRSSRDGLTWTFVLRQGVKFHHGREVTAEDVVYSLTRILDPKTRSGAADLFSNIVGARDFREGRAKRVTGIVASDRYTVQVTLVEGVVPFVSALAVGHAKIVPREMVEAQGEAFGVHPIGTGPFKFVRWERGKEIVLAANPEYFDGPPRLSRLVYRIFPGEQLDAMYRDFHEGHLEDSPLPSRNYREAVSARSHVYVKRPMSSIRFYGLNTRVKPLNDRRVRQALIHALNRDLLHTDVFLDRYTLAHGVLPPGTLGFNPKLKGYHYDPARARELLASAGYPGGRGLPPIVVWSSVKRDEVLREHEQIRKDWGGVGVDVDIRYQMDWPTYSKMLGEGRLAVFLYAWFADVPDPDNFLFKLFHSRSSRNFFGYANPIVDDLLGQARATHDLPRRVELYRKVEQLVLDDAVIVPIFHYTYERLFQPYVRSVEVNGLGDPYIPLRKIWLERPR